MQSTVKASGWEGVGTLRTGERKPPRSTYGGALATPYSYLLSSSSHQELKGVGGAREVIRSKRRGLLLGSFQRSCHIGFARSELLRMEGKARFLLSFKETDRAGGASEAETARTTVRSFSSKGLGAFVDSGCSRV